MRWVSDLRRRRRLRGLAREVARRTSVPSPVVVVLAPAAADLVGALSSELPQARVLLAPAGATRRHRFLTRRGPFDVIVDREADRGRQRRFAEVFWHLRPGGAYVVPGGASELGARPGPLGRLLRDSWRGPSEPVRAPGLSAGERRRRAVRAHVTGDRAGRHLVLTHDLPDAFVKVREEHLNALLGSGRARHRVLDVVPAAAPEPPTYRELPAPRPGRDRRIGRVALSVREYRDVVVGPRRVVLDGRVVLPDSYRHHRARTPRSSALVDVARGFAVPARPLPDRLPRLEGTFWHLDNEYRGHFGHLLTESLTRAWSWSRALALDPDACALVALSDRWPEVPDYELALYEACGIPRDRVRVVDGPVRVERLVAGTPAFGNPHYVHPLAVDTWQQVGDRLASGVRDRARPRRIFLSRRTAKRACLNGAELEAVFVDHGFEVLFPEDHSLGEQVRLFRSAEVIAGYAGTGMFQIAFVAEPRHVIEVTSELYGGGNEFLIAAARRHRLDVVVCRAEGEDPLSAPFRYDEQREGPALRRLLAELPGG